jgi:hypothetical protein
MSESFLKKLISRPPILFPLAALFHLLITASAVISLYPIPLNQRDWLRPLAMLLFTALSLALCFMRKWAAMSYTGLSILCLAMLYFGGDDTPVQIFGRSAFPFNLILSFFILLLFKRFR